MTQPTQDACEQEMEAFLRDGGTLAMLRDVSADSLEQLYSLAFNDYQAGKWETAHKVFQALCMLDHYDVRFFLGLGACRQSACPIADVPLLGPRVALGRAECLVLVESGLSTIGPLSTKADFAVIASIGPIAVGPLPDTANYIADTERCCSDQTTSAAAFNRAAISSATIANPAPTRKVTSAPKRSQTSPAMTLANSIATPVIRLNAPNAEPRRSAGA